MIKIFNIYKITNSLNGKIYVGMTKQTIEKRFIQHSTANTPLGNAMRDCGLDLKSLKNVSLSNQRTTEKSFGLKL